MTTSAANDTDTQGRRVDMIDRLIADHREINALFIELENGTGTLEHRGRVADVIIAELVGHLVVEEQYLYPTARKVLPNVVDEIDHEIAERAQTERIMKQWQGVGLNSSEFDRLCVKLATDLRRHIAHEENGLFPKLRNACSKDELVQLGNQLRIAKQTAPTRPHPSTPDRPPWNKLLAPGTGLVDRIRDMLSNRPTTPQDISRQEEEVSEKSS